MVLQKNLNPGYYRDNERLEEESTMSNSTLGLDDRLQQYVLDVSLQEPEACARLREQTLAMPDANMISSPEQVQLLKLLFKMLGARNGLEIGTFTGYTSLRLTMAMPDLRMTLARGQCRRPHRSAAGAGAADAGSSDRRRLRGRL
jgi:predicted O-methyltransferase YrrM